LSRSRTEGECYDKRTGYGCEAGSYAGVSSLPWPVSAMGRG
jgi:hypothetical protein